MKGRLQVLAVAALTACIGALYFHSFVDYGINFEDEGTLLYQIERTADGERPYLDFHIGYTPAIYHFHAWIFDLFGVSVIPLRYLLLAVNAGAMFLLVLAASRLVPAALAALPALAYMAAIPVHPGAFASFNIPYPVWYNVLLFVAGAVALLRFADDGRLRWVVAAGLAAGVDFMFKPNAGLFQLAASSFVVLSLVPMGPASLLGLREKLGAIAWWGLWTCTMVGTWGVFAGRTGWLEFWVLLAPVTLAALVCAWRSAVTPPLAAYPAVFKAGAALVGSFVVVNLPWMAAVYAQLGAQQFLVKVLFFGAEFETFYYIAHPSVLTKVALLLAAMTAAALAPAALRGSRWGTPKLSVAVLIVCAIATALAARFALMPEGFAAAVNRESEYQVFALTLAVHYAALFAVMRRVGTAAQSARRSAHALILVVCAVFMYLQLYPRTDYMHWVTAAPLSLVLAAWMLAAALRRWSQAQSGLGVIAVYCAWLVPLVCVLALRVAPTLASVWTDDALGFGRPPQVRLAEERAPVWMQIGRTGRYEELSGVVQFLREHTEADSRVFTFPALDLVSFLSDRGNPTRHGYFFPGWPGHDAEAEVVADLMRTEPLYAVVLHGHAAFFGLAGMYYYELGRYLDENYLPFARFGRYAVLRRGAPSPAQAPTAADFEPARMQVPGWLGEGLAQWDADERVRTLRRASLWMVEDEIAELTAALRDADASVRSAAVAALRHARDPAVGRALLEAVRADSLSRRDAVLATRVAAATLDDPGLRSAFALVRESAGRLRKEAVDAVYFETFRRIAAQYWPGAPRDAADATGVFPEDPAFGLAVARWAADVSEPLGLRRAAVWATKALDDETAGAVLADAGVAGDPGLFLFAARESAARKLRTPPLAAVLAAAPGEEAYVRSFIPRVVEQVYEGGENHDIELAELLRFGTRESRREAAWLAAGVGGQHTVRASLANLRDPDPELRMAALWTLHRRNRTRSLGQVERATRDSDFRVREFAERAATALREGGPS